MQTRITPTIVRNAISEVEEHYENLSRVSMLNDMVSDAVELKRWSLEVCKEFPPLTREFKSLVKKLGDNDEIEIEAHNRS